MTNYVVVLRLIDVNPACGLPFTQSNKSLLSSGFQTMHASAMPAHLRNSRTQIDLDQQRRQLHHS
jgi:hypothetical protein